MGVGALEDGHALAAQVLDGLDGGIGRRRQVDVGAHTGGQDQPCFQARGLADNGRQIALKSEVELLVGQRLIDGRARALEEEPLDLDVVFFELFLDPALGMRNRHRAAVKPRWIAYGRLRHAKAQHGRRCLCAGYASHGCQPARSDAMKKMSAIKIHVVFPLVKKSRHLHHYHP